MKNKPSSNFKKITNYTLVLLMIILNLNFALPIRAEGEILTVGSKSGSNGELINISITAESFFSDIGSITLYVDYDSNLFSYLDYTLDQLPASTINQIGNRITIAWFDATGFNPISFNNGDKLLDLNFNVMTSDSITTEIIIHSSSVIGDSSGDHPIVTTFTPGVITLNPDQTGPEITVYTLEVNGE
ncbi:MAG: cohesin domain-containing protein, partial [Candidatus Jacksonbacteria bacterium]